MDPPILYKILHKQGFPTNTFINKHKNRNNNTCFSLGNSKNTTMFHSDDALQIKDQSIDELVDLFNTYSYFINYDLLQDFSFISVACGCVTVVIPDQNVDKKEWLKKTQFYNFLQETGIEGYYGIAYGFEELEWAENTINMAEEQIKMFIKDNKRECYDSFLIYDETQIIEIQVVETQIVVQIKYGINENDAIDITDLVMKKYYNEEILSIQSSEFNSFSPDLYPGISKLVFFSCKINEIEKKRCYIDGGENIYIDFTKIEDIKQQQKIIIYTPGFEYNTGGIVCLHYLGQFLSKYGYDVFMCAEANVLNPLLNKFYNGKQVDEDTIVIYPEIYEGNILNANRIIRWILGPIRVEKMEIVKTWNKNDLVYYFNEEPRMKNNLEKKRVVYKMLSILFLNPLTKNTNGGVREDYCFTLRKTHYYKSITHIHPTDAFEITHYHDQIKCIDIFNNYKYFVCYDPLCFLMIISAVCGCIPIVYPIESVSKNEWLQTLAVSEYCKEHNVDNLYGIAYGLEDLEWAKSTIHLAEEQWKDIIQFNIEKNIENFIEDLNHLDDGTLQNTVENNYLK